MEDQSGEEAGESFENVPEAKAVYLLMKSNIPISRTSRVKWLLDRLNTIVKQDENLDSWDDKEQEFKVLSVLNDVNMESFFGRVSPTTKINLLAGSYRIVFCLDMSPSQCTVDLHHGEILLDELMVCFERTILGISEKLSVPGCLGYPLTPDIYVTVIAHTPFFMSPAQQVLVKGVRISGPGNAVEELLLSVSSELRHLSRRIADVAGMAHDRLDQQTTTTSEHFIGEFMDEEPHLDLPPNIPMVSPDANFVNMLRYSMLALSLLPEYSLSNIIVITDGVVALPDVNIMESLLMQLHYDSTAVSFIKVGSSFHPHISAGYVPYEDVLSFLAKSTMGTCLESTQLTESSSDSLNLYHKAYLTWSFNNRPNDFCPVSTCSQWNGINHYFLGDKAPSLLRKKQTEDKINTSLLHILSRRMREGYTIDKIDYEKDVLRLELSLPWKNFIYLQYTLSAPWPSQQSVVHFQVNITAPYEFLHDITCLMKKELKSSYRQAVVERFWYVLTTLGTSDASTAQHLYSFQTSNNWCTLPESVKSGMPVFVISTNSVTDNYKPQFTAGDTACPKFGGAWQPICQLDNSQLSKWFHTQKISVIVRHDDPRPRNLHLTNSSRSQPVQCRQGAAVLYGRLADWATFVLIENHSYVKFLQWSGNDRPTYFCIIRVTSKLPCAVIHIAFNNGTPGNLRQQVCSELRHELTQLCFVSSPLKSNENACCTILHKPLEKMLIRYERMPNDFSTVVFPDGTQPPNPNSSHMANPQPPLVVGALFTTLSRYLYHKRWVWNATHPTNPKLGVNALARILSTLTKMRLKEGFTFAHSSNGIINMVLEIEMAPPGEYRSLSCIVQYVLFPPHSATRELRPSTTVNSDSSDMDTDFEVEPAELEMVTEVWVEPQYGQVVNSPPPRIYMNDEPYYKLADKIGFVDSKCVNSLLTLEHLSLMCQTKSVKFEELRTNDTCSHLIENFSLPKRRKISSSKKTKGSFSNGYGHSKRENGYFSRESPIQNIPITDSTPPIEERIHHIPFHFNLNNILPISQQAELLFSMFMEEPDPKNIFDSEKPNKMLMEIFHEQIYLLNDRELNIGKEDSKQFLELLFQRHNSPDCRNQKCPISQYSKTLNKNLTDQEIMWRCFIKGVSSTHVMLTFIPANLRDIKILNAQSPLLKSASKMNLETSTSDNNFMEDSTNDYSNGGTNTSLILPVYIYDCPLQITMNSFVNPNKNINQQQSTTKDIYEDYSYSLRAGDYEADSYSRYERSRSPDPKSEDSEAGCELKTCIRQHCRALVLVHVKCFVVALFKSLQLKCNVSCADVQYAVDQCEESTKDIDITEYLHVVCRHFKNGGTLELKCNQLHHEQLETLLQQKFTKIIRTSFQPIPTHPDYYYCQPSLQPTIKCTNKDEDSDDEMSLEMVEFDSSSDSESGVIRNWHAVPHIGMIDHDDLSNSSDGTADNITEITDGESTRDVSRPLFLHLTATVYCRGGTVLPSIPIKQLPTCISELIFGSHQKDLDPLKMRVTLDMICLTLPLEVQAITKELVPISCPRTTSFCSTSPLPSDDNSDVDSNSGDDCERTITRSHHLSDMQLRAVGTLKHEIEWLLRDEIATRLLDTEPVTNEVIQTVIKHVDGSVNKISCKKEVINLNFVYGTTQGMTKFLEEFKHMPLNLHDGTSYTLVQNSDCYYLIKKTTESNTEMDVSQNNSDVSSICGTEDGHFTEQEHDNDDHQYDWLTSLEKKRNVLPNFWIILRIENEIVTVYFHCKFLELQTTKIDSYLRIQNKVIYSVKDLCKQVNQSLLLQSLHDTRNCDRLLEPEDDRKDLLMMITPMARTSSYNKFKSDDCGTSDGVEILPYTEASSKFMPGFFRCEVVWETQFTLHPRLKIGPGKPGLSRGIQALRTVLNKFSVSNRSNMFVYQDNCSNVFYLRLHENCTGLTQQDHMRSLTFANNNEDLSSQSQIVFRSPSIVSLPLNQQKSALHSLDNSLVDVRPRVRSFGEKEREPTSSVTHTTEDTISLRVHGITDAGLDVKRDLVQVLQNRLDDAVLEIISMMLARNAMCPLTPEDVHFLQKPFHPPENLVRLSIPIHIAKNRLQLSQFVQYLRNDLLQFLNVPKYTDSGSHNHFKDYLEPNPNLKLLVDDMLFLYNQSQPTSGNRGVACIAMVIVLNKLSKNENLSSSDLIDPVSSSTNYMGLFENMTFQQIVFTQGFDKNLELEDLPSTFLEFRIWKQGRVNLDALQFKLKSAVSQAIWDLVSEHHLLLAPLCNQETDEQSLINSISLNDSSNSIKPTEPIHKAMIKMKVPGNSRIKRRVILTCIENPLNTLPQQMLITEDRTGHYERGESGVMHPVYSSLLVKWFEFAIELGVPNVKKSYVKLKNRHSITICLRELQHILSNLVPDITLKAFQLSNNTNNEIYIPYDLSKAVSKSLLLIGRNFDQWKHCVNATNDSLPSKSNRENDKSNRQKLLLGTVQSDELILYTYNWSKERVDKLMVQSNSLGMWMSARSSVLNSVVSQKMGLFHNQPVSRKSMISNNPYLMHVTDTSDHLFKFPMGVKSSGNNSSGKQQPPNYDQGISQDAYKDSFPYQKPAVRHKDSTVAYINEMLEIKTRYRSQHDEKKKLHGIWQSRGAASHPLHTNFLRKHSRIIHFCHTPLLFLPKWRLQSAATRDHSLSPNRLVRSESHHLFKRTNSTSNSTTTTTSWYAKLCTYFIKEYKQYLQTLGFVPLELDVKSGDKTNYYSLCFVQKPMLGGIMVFAIQLKEPFFTVKLHAVECCRLQKKVSRNSVNQFTLSFLDECDKIKSFMHLHSFTYDFHLRTIHSYVADSSGPKVCNDYHLTKFLDDFTKYYPKTPNFARNVVFAETLTIEKLLTEGNQLYIYLLSNNKYYNMQVLSMQKEDNPDAETEYVLVQVTSTPQVWYKDSQDQQQTDDFDVTLIVSNRAQKVQPNDNTLYLKFYIILTSRREIFPKCNIEKTLGKFRTVSSGPRSITNDEMASETRHQNSDLKSLKSSKGEGSSRSSNKSRDTISRDMSVSQTSSVISENTDIDQEKLIEGRDEDSVSKNSQLTCGKNNEANVEIKQESVNYIGYYSSHEQLMQQLVMERVTAAKQEICEMVTQGMVHCRTHLLWNRLVSHQDLNQLTYNEFMELKTLAKLENITQIEPTLKLLLDQPFSWYQGLSKLLLTKYSDQHRLYVSPDGNTQHLVVLHPRYSSTFMVTSVDLHTSRGEIYAASRQLLSLNSNSELCNIDRMDLINGFINCIAAHIWSGLVTL